VYSILHVKNEIRNTGITHHKLTNDTHIEQNNIQK